MNIYQTLEKDHKTINDLLDKLVQSSTADHKHWNEWVDQIRNELISHSSAEEAVFYNAIRELNPADDVVRRSYAEHAMAEKDLRTLQTMEVIDIKWTQLAKKLRTELLHHIKKEESKVFLAARKLFTEEEAEMIGRAFDALKPTIKERDQLLSDKTIDLVCNLLPQRLIPGFRKSFLKEEKRSA